MKKSIKWLLTILALLFALILSFNNLLGVEGLDVLSVTSNTNISGESLVTYNDTIILGDDSYFNNTAYNYSGGEYVPYYNGENHYRVLGLKNSFDNRLPANAPYPIVLMYVQDGYVRIYFYTNQENTATTLSLTLFQGSESRYLLTSAKYLTGPITQTANRHVFDINSEIVLKSYLTNYNKDLTFGFDFSKLINLTKELLTEYTSAVDELKADETVYVLPEEFSFNFSLSDLFNVNYLDHTVDNINFQSTAYVITDQEFTLEENVDIDTGITWTNQTIYL